MASSKSRANYVSRAVSIALLICLLNGVTPAASQTIVAFTKETKISFAFWFHSSGLAKLIQGRGPNPRRPETQADRDSKIARLEIFPKSATVDLDDRIRFSAVAYDANDNPVGGVKIKWRAQNPALGRRAGISHHGEFRAIATGSFTISAEAHGKSDQVTVTVRPGPRRDVNLSPTGTRQVSTRDLPTTGASSTVKTTPPQTVGRSSRNSRATNRGAAATKRSHASKTNSLGPEAAPVLPGDGWDDTNYWSADDPGNGLGNTPGTPLDGGAGTGNFQFTAPIYKSSGRGINISMGAAYNSRLWNKAGSQITYDIDRGWPAPGWSLGFGKLLGMGVNNGAMLIDSDGTRHGYTGSITSYSWGTHGVMHTTDGSFIDYEYWTGTGGGINSAIARYANGTVIYYGAGSGHVYPTTIEDANGNLITITYLNNTGPRIQTVTDTLARMISFHYDSNNLLTAITGPGLEGGSPRTLARFHYRQLALNYGFSGLTPTVHDSNPWLMNAIYFPATGTGYWFGDTDSYSSYGMITKVVEQRGMGFSAGSLNEQGSVSQGPLSRRATYNYPATPDYSLTDAPTYTSMVQTWTRDGTNSDSATTEYEVHQHTTPRTTMVTLPNGIKSKQYSYNYSSLPSSDPLKALDGLVYRDETYVTPTNILQISTSTWEKGAYDSPRPLRIEKTDERGQMTAAEFSYGSVYNQVIEVRDFDYGGAALMRATRTTYQNSPNYTNRHIFSLPLTVDVYASDNTTRVSRTEYQYDGQTLTDTPGVVMHDETHNPYAPPYEVCDCNQWDYWQIECLQWNCYWTTNYNSATDYRGNITQVTAYADAAGVTGAVVETRRHDITGNLITAATSCCDQTSFNYTVDTQYAYPSSQTRGSVTDVYTQMTTSTSHDFNTGLTLSIKDANGRESESEYDPLSLRLSTASLPTGAHTHYSYDEVALQVTATTYSVSHSANETAIADQNVKLFNGKGQARQEMARGPDSGQNPTWDAVDTIYNNLGQVVQQSRPYRVGGPAPVFITATYDIVGRTKTVTHPDSSVTEYFYNEITRPDVASNEFGETTRVRDAWGRERWARTDANGRLAEVVEPNPNGNGSVATGGLVTRLAYNTVGNLVTVNSMTGTQIEQTRSFAYDSLGRPTAQKLAEVSATLNSAGTYVGVGGAGAQWGDFFAYDSRSNLIGRTDARGVKTIYSYEGDPLNRLQSVSWDLSGPHEDVPDSPILPAATVTYQYRQKNSASDLKDITQISSVTTADVSTESFSYDSEGRVSSKTLTLTSRPSYPFATNYFYDLLDRVTDVWYPAEYLNGAQPRKILHHDYDIASRLSGLTFDGQSFASNIVYDAASQSTSLSVGVAGANQIIESYAYHPQTGLLDGQTVARASAPSSYLLNLSYDYADGNGKRTGQLTKILNNLNHNKDREYTYDVLGRLAQAKGGVNGALWTQTYSYDRYGNRASVTATGYSARRGINPTASEGSVVAQRGPVTGSGAPATGPGTPTLNSSPIDKRLHHPSRLTASDTGAPGTATSPSPSNPVFTDDPLTPGVAIKAVHVTELRDAINQARAHAGLSAASWAETVASGASIKALHITEMRTRLEEARAMLGLSAASYTDPGLAAGTLVKAVHIQELRERALETLNANLGIPVDGHASLSYNTASNRITSTGFAYDAAGNQIRALIASGSSQRFRYDAANRLVQVRSDDNNTVKATYTYGDSNERLIAQEGTVRTYSVAERGSTVTEYVEDGSTTPAWSKSYVYLGNRLLSTLTPNGSGGAAVQHHHPDRLGTRLVSNPSTGGSFEQVTLPFGVALNAESTDATNRRFTSYDRSDATGLDYAYHRQYDSQQGRFTQVDPIGMRSVNLSSPQTLNLYAYCANDPVNRTDPDGLGFFGFLGRIFRTILLAIAVALIVAVAVLVIQALIPALIPFATSLLGLGLLGIVAQHFVLTVYNGIADEIRQHGFSLGSFFRGLGKGLARFFKSITNPKAAFGLAYYGNYCGPGNPNQSAGREPIDELDAACLEHDRVYQRTNDSRERARADIILALAALRAGLGGRLAPAGSLFSLFITVVFTISALFRMLFGGSSEGPEMATTITVSGGDGEPRRTQSPSRERYQINLPTYTEIINSAPGRVDRFRVQFAGG